MIKSRLDRIGRPIKIEKSQFPVERRTRSHTSAAWSRIPRVHIGHRAENTKALLLLHLRHSRAKRGGDGATRAPDMSRNSTCAVIPSPCSILSNARPAYGGACNFRSRDGDKEEKKVHARVERHAGRRARTHYTSLFDSQIIYTHTYIIIV